MSYPVSLPSNNPIITLTHPTPIVWVLELHNGQDSRINATLIDKALQPALNIVERDWRERWRTARNTKDKEGGRGTLVIVGKRGQNKFFSNGLELDKIMSDPHSARIFTPLIQNPFLRRLLTFPIPTVAAINGHCFAAAMIVALCCDYRVMTDGSSRNAWMCMSEIHFGAAYPISFAAIIRAKVPDPRTQRKVALEGHRFTPPEAFEAGLVDYLVKGDTEAVIAKAQAVGESVAHLAVAGAWGVIKRDLYRDALEAAARDDLLQTIDSDDAAAKARL
ncbi:ClpP/crotonase [Daedalea quercina L-15889]|uniref:ClpP/crotonase n=1 Tax=Daedalea quercina L-15889 TaxID=1314783 RepID=A0A165T977_9APHY|nr:ClpP/crotonase [Daedalea quercina L-15889]